MKRNFFLGFLAGLFLIGFVSVASALPIAWNGHLYDITAPNTWEKAEEEAVAWGGHLVTINDSLEMIWLISTFGVGTPYEGNPQYYIGFNDILVEGTWVWTSGEPVSYTNWADFEPNDYEDDEDIALMGMTVYPFGGKWNDVPDSLDGLVGVMEKSAPVPEPTTMLLLGTGLVGLVGSRLRKKK